MKIMKSGRKKWGFVVPVVLVMLILISGPLSSLNAAVHSARPTAPLSPTASIASGNTYVLALLVVVVVVSVVATQTEVTVATAELTGGAVVVAADKTPAATRARIAHSEFDR
ncbi:MAG TPA: hypothetical protein VF173_07795 [Thermoanaerobaculia bacterium]|nr:hypothetical protein [Thermoanaerobaculia bacterium]